MPGEFLVDINSRDSPLNISKHEQHVLAQGGLIHSERMPNGKVREVVWLTHDSHVLAECSLKLVDRLRERRFIKFVDGKPYRATQLGILTVNP